MLISQPDTGEQALEIVDVLVRSGAVDAVVVDSVAALVPRAEIEGDMGDSHVGLQARLMSQALRKLTSGISRSNTVVIFINQLREKIGVMFGNPETTTGGKALKFYASVRLDIRRIDQIKQGDRGGRRPAQGQGRQEQGGAAVPHRRVRHHVRRGHQQGRRHHRRGRGDGPGQEERRVLLLRRMRLGQGRENAKEFLRQNPDVRDEIERQIRGEASNFTMTPQSADRRELAACSMPSRRSRGGRRWAGFIRIPTLRPSVSTTSTLHLEPIAPLLLPSE